MVERNWVHLQQREKYLLVRRQFFPLIVGNLSLLGDKYFVLIVAIISINKQQRRNVASSDVMDESEGNVIICHIICNKYKQQGQLLSLMATNDYSVVTVHKENPLFPFFMVEKVKKNTMIFSWKKLGSQSNIYYGE